MRDACLRVAYIAYVAIPMLFLRQVLCIHVEFGAAIGHSIKGEFQGTTYYTSHPTVETRALRKDDPSDVEPQENSSHQRRLLQSQTRERDAFPCSLNKSVLAALHNANKGIWLVDDGILLTLDGGIQSLINCTSEHDIIMFKTQDVMMLQSTLTIPWHLTLSGYHEGNLVRHGRVAKADNKVRFTCPMNGPLIVARTLSFVVANTMIIGCNTTYDIILLAENCTRIQHHGQARFVHIDFSYNTLFNHGSIINMQSILCTQLSLEDVEFRQNICDGKGCLLLSSDITLRNIEVLQNRKRDTTSDDCSMFSVQEGSQVFVKNISVVNNEIRVFHVNRSSITISESFFGGNKGKQDSVLFSEAYKGGVLFAKQSEVSIQDSTFARNSASIGGAVFATSSELTIENCSFHKNNAINDRGGAIFANSETVCNLISTNFTRNAANEGGAMYTLEVSLTLKDCKFTRNKALFGGACIFKDDSSIHAERVTLYANQAKSSWGGAIAIITRTEIRINDSIFHHNKAKGNGGVIDASEDCQVHLNNVISTNNTARGNGGSIHFHTRTKVVIVNSNFLGNGAQVGGALYARINSNLRISSSYLTENWSEGSACVFIELNSSMTIVDSNLQRNIAKQKGGAISIHFNSTSVVYNVSIASNEAGTDCGGICLSDHSFLNATSLFVKLNLAKDKAGGVGIFSSSSFLCYSCLFDMNMALDGAGIYVQSTNETQYIAAQLQGCLLVNNSATLSGGGLVFEGPHNGYRNCSSNDVFCGGIVLLNTSCVNNSATQLGSAILATNVEDVLVACHYNGGRYHDFLHQDDLASLTHVSPKQICKSWTGNRLATSRMDGVVGTFGKTLLLSINSTNSSRGVRLVVDDAEGIVLENVQSGKRLPKIKVVVVDAFGNRAAPTIPRSLPIAITSTDKFFQGEFRIKTTLGRGSFSDIVGFKPPGCYTMKITPQISTVDERVLKISVRECYIGEEPTIDNDLCQACDDFSYNFNVSKPGGCTPCPEGSTCKDHYIVPQDGYWHKGPCHNKITECITKDACKYKSRHDQLVNFTENFTDCNMTYTTLEEYNNLQCNKGYKGCLCGSCDKLYGLSRNLECLKCEFVFFSLLRLFGIIVYLLVGTTLTIKGTLSIESRRLVRQDAFDSFREDLKGTSVEEETNFTVVEMTLLRNGASQEVMEKEQVIPQTINSRLAHGIETTEGNLVETWKILLNFVQVTSTAATMNVKWTKNILKFFNMLSLIGFAAINSISRPIDCVLGSTSIIGRPIRRYLFSLFIPMIVTAIVSVYWSYRSRKIYKIERFYFLRRFMLTLITITYIMYFDLTQLAVKAFNCVVVYDNIDPLSKSFTRYWIEDTSIECYKSTHIVLIGIAFVVLILVSTCFPLLCSVALYRKRHDVEKSNSRAHETLGLLCGPFKTNFVYWECITMIKKAFLSIIIVFSYSLGNRAQGLLISLVLMFFLTLQTICLPFKDEFKSLNYYEIISLSISCATYTIVQFFNVNTLSEHVKGLASISLIVLNGGFIIFMVFLIARNLIRLAIAVLFSKSVKIHGMGWFSILRLYFKNKESNIANA